MRTEKKRLFDKRTILLLIILLLHSASTIAAKSSKPAPLAGPEDISRAVEVFKTWTEYYLEEKYDEQFLLIHPQKRRHPQRWKKKTWKRLMHRSIRESGKLLNYEIIASDAIEPEKIPCSERGHCFRKGLQLVAIVVRSEYEKAGKIEKEYIVMANSKKGWRYAGGNFLNYFIHETDLIFDRSDERRYQTKDIVVRE